MGIKFGEIDANQILDNEFKLRILEQLFDWVLVNNPKLKSPSNDDVIEIRDRALERLNQKYPKSGIRYKEE
jgi:hydrogenase maturation factor HypF (carbamoyltransferase family)